MTHKNDGFIENLMKVAAPLKSRERQSHYNEIVTRLVEIRFTIK